MKSTSTASTPPRRRWFRFGPGLLLALTALAWGWPYLFPSVKPPRIERTQIADAPVATPRAPDPAWLLTQRAQLQMSDAQLQKLRRLEARWQRDTRDLQSDLNNATRDFNSQMRADTNQKTGATIEQLQARAAPVTALSRQLAGARRAWWDEAKLVLNDEQRKSAQTAWQRHLAGRLAPAPGQTGRA